MRFIADENVARLVISSLRQQGHDVVVVVEDTRIRVSVSWE
jgi:hypothetical protein